ncbi:hypothetical protein QBC42DRAFT_350941 [Cladorrhinum samala]|uniref:TeaA receptor TeaR n=1 Tax=Cladorrhinum samala TaxID=585594 RepID=A0AAV9H7Z4_9PEZI|nr:hypothetical protein QBC42DRAFT_350941 [Cladorrhinum samala]
MAAVSQTATTLTPPASSHDTSYSWEISVAGHADREKALHDAKRFTDDDDAYPAYRPQNGIPIQHSTANGESGFDMKANNFDSDYNAQRHHNESKFVDNPVLNGGADHEQSESLVHGINGRRDITPNSDSEDNSKWIHRDKLAKIENEELQAAGIFLPQQRDRARSKSSHRPKRDQSQDKLNGSNRSIGGSDQQASRSRKNSVATTLDHRSPDTVATPSWDLRRPEEIVEEGDGFWISAGSGKHASKIPIAKTSPVPLPSEHIERDTLLARKRDGSPGTEESITYPKIRTRSGSTGIPVAKPTTSDGASPTTKRAESHSPKKPQNAKKAKTAANGRPKTRGGLSKDSTGSGTGTTRPTTKSGEREFSANSRPMEGEPPWMVSAYRPDPRLPPDQQLLPTVAKRLAQERWEKEGKFGNVYDKDFRPLTDEGFLKPPEPSSTPERDAEKDEQEQQGEQGEWPLKTEARSPTLPGRTNSYSTMPKISDKSVTSPVQSPRTPIPQIQPPAPATVRLPEPPEDPPNKKEGCGCCIVM